MESDMITPSLETNRRMHDAALTLLDVCHAALQETGKVGHLSGEELAGKALSMAVQAVFIAPLSTKRPAVGSDFVEASPKELMPRFADLGEGVGLCVGSWAAAGPIMTALAQVTVEKHMSAIVSKRIAATSEALERARKAPPPKPQKDT